VRDDPVVVDLVLRARAGDQRAWDEIVERFAPLVWGICMRHRLSPADADDVGQSLWLGLLEHLQTLREPAALPGWIATTTRRECLRLHEEAKRRLQADGRIKRAMVVDVDVHHGNGTAAVFAGDPSVFTLSIHQFNNYPSEKPLSSLDIHLADGTGDAEYLHRLGNGYRAALAMFRPELLLYVAGADPYVEDQLGGLSLTLEGLMERDRLVIRTALTQGIPVAIVLAGGYAQSVEDTITIHANTAAVAKDVLEKVPPRRIDG